MPETFERVHVVLKQVSVLEPAQVEYWVLSRRGPCHVGVDEHLVVESIDEL